MHVQVLNDTGGNTITLLAVGSGQVITTEGINTERHKTAGIFLVFTGTVNSITKAVSYDNSNFYVPFDKTSSLANCLITTANNSRFISLDMFDSGNAIVPYTRYNVGMLSGGTLSLVYVAEE